MRTPFVAGNWKMNKTASEAATFTSEMLNSLKEIKGVEIVLCPPFPSLVLLANILKGSDVGLGAQNMHWEKKGAFTGEVSPEMVVEFCRYVIIGHSERRKWFGESDETVNKKVKAALEIGLIPIICIGETEEEFSSNQTRAVIVRQLKDGLKDISTASIANLVIAYEPIWAIGTGRASTGENAENVIKNYIRKTIADYSDVNIANKIRILYGGSVTKENAKEFFNQPDIDGALVGGASLKADEFIHISRAALRS